MSPAGPIHIVLDLSVTAFRHRRGDVDVIGTWFFSEPSRPRPALVLVPAFKEGHERTTPCIVPLDTAWMWSEAIGDPRHVARMSHRIADRLGLAAHDPWVCIRVAGLVRDHLGDLIRMPVFPKPKQAVADAVTVDAQGRERHAEVLGHV